MRMKVCALSLSLSFMMASTALAAKPNIIIFLSDDLGPKDISATGGPIPTPGIDSLANEGLKYGNFYAAPYCTPSRDQLMTGRYNQRNHLENALVWNGLNGIPDSDITLAEALKAGGYRTSLIGKWHLGGLSKFNPVHHGFDYFFGITGGQLDYFTHIDDGGVVDWWRNTERLTNTKPEYSTTAFTREALARVTDGDKPFFLYMAYQAVHVPFKSASGITGQAAYNPIVKEMDASIKTIMDKVHTLKSETVVFFMSDNGGGLGHNGNLRAGKGSVYEGGTKVPMIASWPGHILKGYRPGIGSMMDLYPTILHLAGVSPPNRQLDGLDLTSNMTAGPPIPWRRLYWRQDGNKAVRNGRWKLVVPKGKAAELYDLDIDPSESHNVAGSHPKIVATERSALALWENSVK